MEKNIKKVRLLSATIIHKNSFQLFLSYTFWLEILIIAQAVFFIFYLIFNYYSNKKNNNAHFDKQQDSVKEERQRISSEIHDDIGAKLFAIKLFTDLLSKQREDIEFSQISTMVNEVSEKIKEIIWSTNFENDNLENLIYYIQAQATSLCLYSGIVVRSFIPNLIPDINIPGEKRKNIYLVVKEIVYNAVKHSMASNIELILLINNSSLKIIIRDNGIGFDPNQSKPNSIGLINVRSRIEKMRGRMQIKGKTEFVLEIPLS